VQNCLISTSAVISDAAIVFIDPNFLQDARIPAIRQHIRQKLAYLCLHGFSGPFRPKMPVLGGNRGRGGVMLTPTNLFFLLEVVMSVPLLAKLIKKHNRESAVHTERRTHTVTETN